MSIYVLGAIICEVRMVSIISPQIKNQQSDVAFHAMYELLFALCTSLFKFALITKDTRGLSVLTSFHFSSLYQFVITV